MKQQQIEDYVCRICGFLNKNSFYDEYRNPLYEICPCCGAESGYEDTTPSAVDNNRRKWIQEGSRWFHPELKPDNWDLEAQLLRIGVKLSDYRTN